MTEKKVDWEKMGDVVALDRQKAEMAMIHGQQQHAAKQADTANRANERQMLARQKSQQGFFT